VGPTGADGTDDTFGRLDSAAVDVLRAVAAAVAGARAVPEAMVVYGLLVMGKALAA